MIPLNSLVLYKNHPARVRQTGEKLEIELEGGKTLSVRPKDVVLLHPGPVSSLGSLPAQPVEVDYANLPENLSLAWEILQGSTFTLAELADLIYGSFTPVSAWKAWQWVAAGLHFQGEPEALTTNPPEDVERQIAARQARQAEDQAYGSFFVRLRAGQIVPGDERFLRDVEDLAYRRRDSSKTLRLLERPEQPEAAHALLLELGLWDEHTNPHPVRMGLPLDNPNLPLPELPDEERLDLTHLPAFAIDDEGNQDPDDAVSLDGERLWVHVADVAALVEPGSSADQEARGRGANLYLPEGTVQMLPVAAIQRLGLGLNEISPALSFGIQVGALENGSEALEVEIIPSWVKVQRLSYAAVEARLQEEPFASLYRLAQANLARRTAAGAMEIDLPEVKLWVEDGQVHIRQLPALRSRSLVREAMLLAGEAAARFAYARGFPIPFATQGPPRAGESHEGMAGLFAKRRTLAASQARTSPAPHTGLGLTMYLRTTSPLRRYLDLTTHQQLRAYLKGEQLLSEAELVERIGQAEAATTSVNQAEFRSRLHWTLVYLMQNPGWTGEGIVVDQRGSRARVILPDLALEPQISLRRDLPLNSEVRLKFQGANLPMLEGHFSVVP